MDVKTIFLAVAADGRFGVVAAGSVAQGAQVAAIGPRRYKSGTSCKWARHSRGNSPGAAGTRRWLRALRKTGCGRLPGKSSRRSCALCRCSPASARPACRPACPPAWCTSDRRERPRSGMHEDQRLVIRGKIGFGICAAKGELAHVARCFSPGTVSDSADGVRRLRGLRASRERNSCGDQQQGKDGGARFAGFS